MAIKRGRYDLQVYRGDTPTWKMQLFQIDDVTGAKAPIDLSSGFTVNAQVRYNSEATDILYTLPIQIIDAKNGVIKITVPKTASESLLPAGSSAGDQAVYDMQISKGQSVFTIMTGGFSIVRDVTRL
ncbi:hypothetical protein [Aeromonas salmonicida]|uniref:hypothetical protein n=1 Tax=Aeromonas salmonicida TaxID=645 RepID=UPI003D31B4E7